MCVCVYVRVCVCVCVGMFVNVCVCLPVFRTVLIQVKQMDICDVV